MEELVCAGDNRSDHKREMENLIRLVGGTVGSNRD
jgi:hypothetical protein